MIYAWISVETATLSEPDEILEVAVALTSSQLEPIPGGSISLTILPCPESRVVLAEKSCDPALIRRMAVTKILNEFSAGIPLPEVERAIVDLIASKSGTHAVHPIGDGVLGTVQIITRSMPALRPILFIEHAMELAELRETASYLWGYDPAVYHTWSRPVRAMEKVTEQMAEATFIRNWIRANHKIGK